MSNFVFWDIQNLTDTVLKVNGVSISPTRLAQDMKYYDTAYSVVPDDTGVHVLTYTGSSAPTLDFEGYKSVGVEFTGGRPERPSKPK